jgi:hypothetical protein
LDQFPYLKKKKIYCGGGEKEIKQREVAIMIQQGTPKSMK